jgi:hypothetical protein
MRESSSEKDLKILMGHVTVQLEGIKSSYEKFSNTQIELVKHYPAMVREELISYEDLIFQYFRLLKKEQIQSMNLLEKDEPHDNNDDDDDDTKTELPIDSLRHIISQVVKSDRGTRFYVKLVMEKPKSVDEEANNDDLLTFNNLLSTPTSKEILSDIEKTTHLRNSFIPLILIEQMKETIRINFLNHLERWKDEADERASSIVAAKTLEIEKELELRKHLHEPRIKRAKMDVHNVRAAELLMHEDRVERHCKGIEQTISNMEKKFITMQTDLIEAAQQNKLIVSGIESEFATVTKSLRLMSLKDQLNKQLDSHTDFVKATLRNFRAKYDETISYLRTSNAKFRANFNIFSEGGNFSSIEIDQYKKKLEKQAALIDREETIMLKDMEKIEKKHLEEAMASQYAEKFNHDLDDIKFIEKISRWLNDSQINIKTQVNLSNNQAKQLNEMLNNFERMIDACERPNLDKETVTPNDLIQYFDKINLKMYERAAFLDCLLNKNNVPLFLQSNNKNGSLSAITSAKSSPSPRLSNSIQQGSIAVNLKTSSTPVNRSPGGERAISASVNGEKTIIEDKENVNTINNKITNSSKVVIEDPAVTIMKNLLNNQDENNEELEQNKTDDEVTINTNKSKKTNKNRNKKQKHPPASTR